MSIHLTDMAIRKLPFSDGSQVRYRDTNLPGFGLLVGKRTKTFIVTVGKARRNITLGRYPAVSLSEARRQAMLLLATKPQKNPVTSLTALVNAYLEDCRDRLRPASIQRYADVLNKSPDIPINQVKRTLAQTAHEIKAYKALFNWAMREEITDRNPFQYLRASYGKRERVLTSDEIRTIWHYDRPPFSTIIKLLLLTGQRRNQMWKLQPGWIKEDTRSRPV